jgi:hypothetical protein
VTASATNMACGQLADLEVRHHPRAGRKDTIRDTQLATFTLRPETACVPPYPSGFSYRFGASRCLVVARRSSANQCSAY